MTNLLQRATIKRSIQQNQKAMPKPKKQTNKRVFRMDRTRGGLLLIAMLIAVLFVSGGFKELVRAVSCSSVADCQQQISNLNGQNAQTQQQVNSLQLQAESYQAAIGTLDAQIGSLEQQISNNQAQQASIEAQMTANQQQITIKKASLADDIKTMYIEGSMSTIEQLATSKNLSAYVDKQEYQTVVQNQLTAIIKQIAILQDTLQKQKAQIDQLLAAQTAQNDQLSAAQAQQSQLLSYNQSQQDSYNAQVSTNQHKISTLQAQQAAIIQAGTQTLGSGGNGSSTCNNGNGSGGYPWCNDPLDYPTVAGGFPNRECTAYAYWYFTAVEGHSDFQVTGNANQWLNYSSYPTHSAPQVGGIAVETAGAFGHVAIVQALPGDTFSGQTVPAGYIAVSEMNYDYAGHFRYSFSPLSKFTGYIY
jgi:surface antigen